MLLQDYARIVMRRGWMIVLVMLLTSASAYGFSKLQIPIYQATARVSTRPARPDLGLTDSSKTLLRNFVALMDTEPRAQQVIDQLKLDMTPDDLLNHVTITSDESRFLILFQVRDTDPAVASRIADTWADLLVQWRQSENQTLQRQDYIEADRLENSVAGLYSPQTKINVAAGAILGALLGILIVFGVESVASRVIRTPQDMERFVGLPVIAAIPAVHAVGSAGSPSLGQRVLKRLNTWAFAVFGAGAVTGAVVVAVVMYFVMSFALKGR